MEPCIFGIIRRKAKLSPLVIIQFLFAIRLFLEMGTLLRMRWEMIGMLVLKGKSGSLKLLFIRFSRVK